jgi:hypothetical protein
MFGFLFSQSLPIYVLYSVTVVDAAVMVQGLTLPTFTSMILGSIPGLVKDIF